MKKSNAQARMYDTFITKHNVSIADFKKAMYYTLRAGKMVTFDTWEGLYFSKQELEDLCNWHFQQFIGHLSVITGKTFKKRHENRSKSHYDSWQEANLDGSFAYSEVTDDF